MSTAAEGSDVPDDSTETARLRAENKRLRDAILDIDAHAVSIGSDPDGFNSGGYIVSLGALHRALGVIGHSGVTPREHAVSLDLAHGDGCQGCQVMKLAVLDSIGNVAIERWKESRRYG